MPIFSVVIPTYNRVESLRMTIASVQAQTVRDLEIIIMDDGSTDTTAEVINAIEDRRIRYRWDPNSGGPATPRNRALEVADSEWVAFLDSDDTWHPRKLERMLDWVAAHPRTDAVCHDLAATHSDGKSRRLTCGPFESGLYRRMLLTGNPCLTSAMCVRRSFIAANNLRFNESSAYVIVEDFDFWLHLAHAGGSISRIPEILGCYSVGEGSISLDHARHVRNFESMLHSHVFEIQDFDLDRDRLWRWVSIQLTVPHARRIRYNHGLARATAFSASEWFRHFSNQPKMAISYLGTKSRRRLAGLRK